MKSQHQKLLPQYFSVKKGFYHYWHMADTNYRDYLKGDMVWAWDEETGDIALKKVVETYINETDELIHLLVNGEEIVCTPSHPFY